MRFDLTATDTSAEVEEDSSFECCIFYLKALFCLPPEAVRSLDRKTKKSPVARFGAVAQTHKRAESTNPIILRFKK